MTLPDVTGVTAELSMLNDTAPTTTQESSTVPPVATVVGFAVKLVMVGAVVGEPTVTVVVAVVVPVALVAESVNVVVAFTVTGALPVVSAVWFPTPLLMVSEVAPLTLQESVALPPAETVAGLAVKLAMTGAPEPASEPDRVLCPQPANRNTATAATVRLFMFLPPCPSPAWKVSENIRNEARALAIPALMVLGRGTPRKTFPMLRPSLNFSPGLGSLPL